MRKVKSILALAMTLMMGASLMACKTNNTTQNNGTVDTSKEVTITYVMLGDPPKNPQQVTDVTAKINEKLKAKVNAKLELRFIPWADWQTKYNLMLASKEEVDLVTAASDWLDLWPNAQKGAFTEITSDMVEKYLPQTAKDVSATDWDQCKYDGKIVAIPENKFTQWVNHGYLYRGDWAKEFGINEKITDWNTIGKYLQGVKDKKDVIPFDAAVTSNGPVLGWFISNTMSIPLDMVPTGFSPIFWTKSYDDKYTSYSPYFDQTFVDFAKLMKDWGDKGFWREDVLNYKGDPNQLLVDGKNGLGQQQTNWYKGVKTDMDTKIPGSDLQIFPFSDQKGNLISMPITHGATSLGAGSKNPERALMVYDLLRNDPEIYKLLNYGIEGVNYVVKDGKRYFPDGYNKETDEFYSNFWGGRVDKNEIPNGSDYTKMPEIYAHYDSQKKDYPYGRFAFDKTNVESELAAISDVTSKYLPAIAFGKAGEPEKAVADFRENLKKAGYDKVLAEVQKQLDAYKTLMGGK